MTPATAEAIEDWLYAQGGWVTSAHLCSLFDVSDRQLRPRGHKAGLLDHFAISRHHSGGGYIHIDHATAEEVGSYCNRTMDHGRAEVERGQNLLKSWQAGPRRTKPLTQQALPL